jgi:hypothetical protein
MKTSQLIKHLQQIDKDIPFDADIVTGDDWNFQEVEKIYHDMPRTFIQFGEPVMGESNVASFSNHHAKKIVQQTIEALSSGLSQQEVIILLRGIEDDLK